MTLPSADRDKLIFVASLSLAPVACVLLYLSEPAKSTKFNVDTLNILLLLFVVVDDEDFFLVLLSPFSIFSSSSANLLLSIDDDEEEDISELSCDSSTMEKIVCDLELCSLILLTPIVFALAPTSSR